MRTRMSGGVRGVRSNAAPISIIVIRRFWKPNLILSVLVRPLHGHHRNRIRIVFIGYCRPADL